MLEWSPDQEAALWAAREWRRSGSRPYLTIGGYAGTGKSTLVTELAKDWGDVAVCALWGKAAHVLRAKGTPATTIHSLIYVPRKDARGQVRYRRRDHLGGTGTIIVDEAGMLDHVLLHDLLSFGIPTLFVGDHGQLEPIGTNPGLMKSPDVRLENVHRQALGNPILRAATAFREGREVPYSSDPRGRLEVVRKGEFDRRIAPAAQIICGFNPTRHRVNAMVRTMLGLNRFAVCPDDRLICLRNDKQCNLFNGQQVTVEDVGAISRRTTSVTVRTDDGRILTVECLTEQFGRDLIKEFRSKDVVMFDYGYCLTAHKAQGAEWDEVLVLEEISQFWDARRWRYTVATRAKQRLVYCR
jgi:exodeoxyribonuclease-5